MFAKIVHFSIRKKLFVALTTLLLLACGIYSMLTLPIDAVPDITNNQVQIVTVSPTLAPQEVEQLITFPIEIAMSNVMNVEETGVRRIGFTETHAAEQGRLSVHEEPHGSCGCPTHPAGNRHH